MRKARIPTAENVGAGGLLAAVRRCIPFARGGLEFLGFLSSLSVPKPAWKTSLHMYDYITHGSVVKVPIRIEGFSR